MPMPSSAPPIAISHSVACATRVDEERERTDPGPDHERQARAERGRRAGPAHGPGDQHHERARQHQQAGAGDRRAEAVAEALGRLRELRDEQERGEHREADQHAGDVRHQHGAAAQHAHVHERLVDLRLHPHPERADGEAAEDEREHARRAPAPGVGLAEPVQEARRARPTAARRRASPRARPAGSPRAGRSARSRTRAGSAISPSQNSHEASSASTIGPAITSPTPPPMPNVALIPPIAVGTRSGGNVSRMIPNASGKIPPPTPWMTRPATSTPSDGASAHTTLPAAKTSSTIVRTAAAAEEVAELADDRRRDRGGEQVAGEDPGGRRRRRRRTRAGSPAARGRRPSARARTPSPPAAGRGRRPACDPRAVGTSNQSRANPDRSGPNPPTWGHYARSTKRSCTRPTRDRVAVVQLGLADALCR